MTASANKRVAFYAPLKSPRAETPSGDRRMARLLIQALQHAGYEVDLAARLRTRDGRGEPGRQSRLRSVAEKLADRMIRKYRSGAIPRPDYWFTYHLYYKAPDWIGPVVADALRIPYIIAEASYAPKRAGGPWDNGHKQSEVCLQRADAVIGFNSLDRVCVEPVMSPGAVYKTLPPFIDLEQMHVRPKRHDETTVHLLAVGMMRDGDKFQSYGVLADALAKLGGNSGAWHLTIVGDGPRRPDIIKLFEPFANGVSFTGAVDLTALADLYGSADIFVWPAVNEAYGMAILEAQAAGLPVVAGRAGGVADIVDHGKTGLLSDEGDSGEFADNLARLIDTASIRQVMGQAAAQKARTMHGIEKASADIAELLQSLHTGPGR